MNEPLQSLERLGLEFERVAREPRRRHRIRRRALLFAAAGALLVSAVALAASGVLTGAPVKDPPGVPRPRPHFAFGVVNAGSVTLTALRTSDPAGGPDWGLRTMTTTRAQGCVQVGRVVDGRLGVLGQDSSFGDDGRFHELRADVESGRDCALLDGKGKLFIAMSVQGLPASGQGGRCVARRPPDEILRHLSKVAARRQAATPLCPHEDMRILYYGTLGAQAASVTYEERGVRKTVPTSGPWGAYLVVARPDHKRPALGYFVPGTSPASGLVAITYRDGHVCRIRDPRALGGAKACPRVGYVPPRAKTPSQSRLATPVSASFSTAPGRPKSPDGKPLGPKNWVLHVTFTARVAAGPRSFYFVTVDTGHCHNFGGFITSPIARDVRAGEVVRTTHYIPIACHGTISGDVRFQGPDDRAAPAPFESSNPRRAPVVGAYSAQIPRR
jgi:hypothetical protein